METILSVIFLVLVVQTNAAENKVATVKRIHDMGCELSSVHINSRNRGYDVEVECK